jgi:myo-inositol 2-dehydrogenase / D-chiro-inositol 1-dehydrogenase
MERRDFVKNSAFMSGTIILPTIVPSTVFGKNAPSNKINIAQIGFGRIAMTHDLAETLNYDQARVIAVADLDSLRAAKGKQFIENFYSKKPEVIMRYK